MVATILRPTKPDDLDFVLAAESDPENSRFVYLWDRKQHIYALTHPIYRHYIIYDPLKNERLGYVILDDVTNPSHSINLRRIVVTKKGHKIGQNTLYQIQKIAFIELKAHRLWLDVFVDNDYAYNLYLKTGFRCEGLLVDSYLRENQYVSQYIMAILSSEFNHEKA